MDKFNFERNIIIRDNIDLQKLFGNSTISLDKNSSVEFTGSISISENISFRGKCIIGDDVSIDNGSILENTNIGSRSIIRPYSFLNNSVFGENNLIGPFCFVRDHTKVGDSCTVGSHVEIARSNLGNSVKISHQSYIGDALIDDKTIIGAGTVFCNFREGFRQKSIVGKEVTIGSGTMIISPVKIGNHTIIGAGSVITKDLIPNSKIIQKR